MAEIADIRQPPPPGQLNEQEDYSIPEPEIQNEHQSLSAFPKFDDMPALQVGLILLRYLLVA